jgi:hypothetical protein
VAARASLGTIAFERRAELATTHGRKECMEVKVHDTVCPAIMLHDVTRGVSNTEQSRAQESRTEKKEQPEHSTEGGERQEGRDRRVVCYRSSSDSELP